MRKAFDIALKVFLFLSPIFTFKNYQVSFARGLFFIIGVFILFGISLGIDQKRKLSNIWLSCFLLLALLRVFFENNIGTPGSEWFNFFGTCSSFIYLFCGFLLFQIVYCYAENIKQYLKPIISVCVLNLVITIAQVFNYDFMWSHTNYLSNFCGFMETSTQLGQYSAMTFPILYSFNPLLAIIPLITLFIAKSSTPIIALFAGLLFFGWQSKKKIPVVIITATVVLWGFFNASYIQKKFYTRPIIWKKTLSVTLKKPFLGWGYQTFKEKVAGVSDKIGRNKASHAYNDYLHTAQELGIPIVVTMGLFFVGIFKKFNNVRNKDKLLLCLAFSVVVVLVNMLGQGLIRYASLAGTFITLLALLSIKIEEK